MTDCYENYEEFLNDLEGKDKIEQISAILDIFNYYRNKLNSCQTELEKNNITNILQIINLYHYNILCTMGVGSPQHPPSMFA